MILISNFRHSVHMYDLAMYVGISYPLFKSLLHPDIRSDYFKRHDIPKRNGDTRSVWEAHEDVADGYKAFARRFDLFVRKYEPRYPHPASYGFVKGKSTLENAQLHCKAKYLLKADIKNFFPSIKLERLYKLFLSLGLKEFAADALAKFCTIDSMLAPGLSSSPMLANLICLDLDDKLVELAARYNCKYSRYADDISISGDNSLPSKEEVSEILESEGFQLCERKFRQTKSGQSHFVTGLSINDSKPHVPKHMKRKLRQTLYYCKKFGIDEHAFHIRREDQKEVNRIDGMVRYVSHIEKDTHSDIRNEWKDMLEKSYLNVSYHSWSPTTERSYRFYIDESEFSFQGKTFLALGLCKTSSWDEIENSTEAVLKSYLARPFSQGDLEIIRVKNVHFTDAHPSLREKYIDKLCDFDMRGYIVYCELKSPNDYKSAYLSLLKKVLPHRLIATDGTDVKLIFEENSKINKAELRDCVMETYQSLKRGKNRCPKSIEVKTAGKNEHLCFSMPDFLLGIFQRYACYYAKKSPPKSDKNSMDKMFFEQIRDKCRIIMDVDNNFVFSRKRPFEPWSIS